MLTSLRSPVVLVGLDDITRYSGAKLPFTSRVEGKDICGPVLHTPKESGGLFTSRGPERDCAALNLSSCVLINLL